LKFNPVIFQRNIILKIITFAVIQQIGLPLSSLFGERGKSGQRRAPYFLTGSCPQGQSSVTENNRFDRRDWDKGEKAG